MSTFLPKISIITSSYNQGQYIEETICSVLDQNYPNLEYIIIDGGSTDNSVEIIKQYAQHLKYWVSEKDGGQANAINKGLQYCTGEIFNWLNSDDYLQPGALKRIADAFNGGEVNLVAGKVNKFSMYENELVANKSLSAAGLMRWDEGVQFIQPGVWMRRGNFIEAGGVNEQLHYAFDWDLVIRYLYFFPQVKYIDEVLVNFRLHEGSKTVCSSDKFVEEERRIIEAIFADPSFKKIHPVCKWKIHRAEWTKFLIDTAARNGRSKAKKIYTILTNLSNQPADSRITRMTLGAIKQIMLS